jgi:hypothetical protein
VIWLWLGVGATIGIAALFILVAVLNFIDKRMCVKNATIRKRQYDAETAMVRTVQNTIAEMFDTVRRQR